MHGILRIIIILLIGLQLSGCKKSRFKVDISGIEDNLEIVRFDVELFGKGKDFTELHNQYPRFCDLFTYKVLNIGGSGMEGFDTLLNRFMTDTMIVNVRTLVAEEFASFDPIGKDLKKAFRYYRFHFPDKEVPKIYTFISGFNQSVVTDENLIGIGLDKYLGRKCKYYHLLGLPKYKIQKMYKERIPSDVMYAWAMTEFVKKGEESNLLSQMIHEGKLMYFVDAMLPDSSDSVKFGYTPEQLNWCRRNEAKMWSTLIDNRMLYSTKRMDIIRYTGDAPTTSGFPLESPGRTGSWMGWQIVRKYMDKNPEISLAQLMNEADSQKILNYSGYFPE